MIDHDGYPAGVPCWVDTEQPDPRAAADFYTGLFGWEFEEWTPAGAPGTYLVGRLGGRDVAAVSSRLEAVTGPSSWQTYVAVDDADAVVARATAVGGAVTADPYDVPGAGRMAALADPDGAAFRVWQARGHQGAQAVNVAGTWNWSNLNTHDPQQAAAFYGEVFGWRAAKLDFGFGDSWMWQLPGYGDVLAERDPDLRRRHADPNVPAGFSDAIGWLAPLPATESPHWSVTFAVDDAFGAVERAERLGATVVTPAFDAGGAQIGVLTDPQGAVFTVSRYAPPAD